MNDTVFHIFLIVWGVYHFYTVFCSVYNQEVHKDTSPVVTRWRFVGYVLLAEYLVIVVWAASLLHLQF
jgi:hypothetical protein